MTNYSVLYARAQKNLTSRPEGVFRFADICDDPPAGLGRRFRNDVVRYKKFPNVRRIGADERSVLYEKFDPGRIEEAES